MYKISIKPLSVNAAWQGRRFKTEEYKNYEVFLFYLLPETIKLPKTKKVKLILKFGVSSKLADIDNPVKPFIDILQKRYGFNDKQIYRLEVEKKIVEKEQEYIEFELSPFVV